MKSNDGDGDDSLVRGNYTESRQARRAERNSILNRVKRFFGLGIHEPKKEHVKGKLKIQDLNLYLVIFELQSFRSL